MKKLKSILSALLVLSSHSAAAHGQEVLVTVFLQFGAFVFMIVGLLMVKMNRKGKIIIGVIAITAFIATSFAISGLPYQQYRTLINVIAAFAPITIVTLSYLGLRNKFQKH